ncbi:MAG: hypothetical protein AAF409_18325 [Pseudomonadota bacterium]
MATQPSPTAIPEATTPEGFEALKQMLDRGTPDEKRRAIASLTVAQCFLKNTAENTFRGVAEGSDGLEKRTTTTDGVDVYVDEEVGMMMGLSDELCHVMIAGSDVAAVADIVEPSLGFGGGGEQTYQSTDDGFGVRFIGDGGQKFLSVVRADTIPGSDNTPSVSVFVFKES